SICCPTDLLLVAWGRNAETYCSRRAAEWHFAMAKSHSGRIPDQSLAAFRRLCSALRRLRLGIVLHCTVRKGLAQAFDSRLGETRAANFQFEQSDMLRKRVDRGIGERRPAVNVQFLQPGQRLQRLNTGIGDEGLVKTE